MTKLNELQFFLNSDARKFVGRMLMIDRFKINQYKFDNSLGTSNYYHNLIIFSNMACEMLIESS